MINFKKISLSLAVTTALSLSGCGSSSSDDTNKKNEVTTRNYNGAGSRWDLAFESDGKATIKELDSNLEINATYEDLASGFRKITVVSSSDTSKANVGNITYGFDLPDYMFPFISFTENKLIPTVKSGVFDSSLTTIRHNYILSYGQPKSENDVFDKDNFLGYWIGDNEEQTLQVTKLCLNGNIYSQNTYNFNITEKIENNGKWIEDEDEKRLYYMTASGGLIYHVEAKKGSNDNPSNKISNAFMIPYEPNLNTINQINGNYIGYLVSGSGYTSIGYENTPVRVTVVDGLLSIKDIDVNTNVTGDEMGTIQLTNEVTGTKGLWYGQVKINETEEIGCAIDLNTGDSGKNVVICSGMKPDGTSKRLYSLILVSK